MVTLAPFNAPPDGSVTAPTIVPKTCWALSVPLKQNSSAKETHAAHTANLRRLGISSPFPFLKLSKANLHANGGHTTGYRSYSLHNRSWLATEQVSNGLLPLR